MMQHHLIAAILLLALIMVLNLETWKSRLAYLAMVTLSFSYLSVLQAAVSIIAITTILIFYAAVAAVQSNARLHHKKLNH